MPKILNNPALASLTTWDEQRELEAVGLIIARKKAIVAQNRVLVAKLKRTYTMMGFRYWRVVGPVNHPSLNSDLSELGLKEWGII